MRQLFQCRLLATITLKNGLFVPQDEQYGPIYDGILTLPNYCRKWISLRWADMATGGKILLSFSGLPLKPECIKGISQVAVFEYRPRGNPWMGTRCYAAIWISCHSCFFCPPSISYLPIKQKNTYNSNQGVGKCTFFRIWTLPSNSYWRLYHIIYIYHMFVYRLFCWVMWRVRTLKKPAFWGETTPPKPMARWAMLCSWAPLEWWRCRCGHLGVAPV